MKFTKANDEYERAQTAFVELDKGIPAIADKHQIIIQKLVRDIAHLEKSSAKNKEIFAEYSRIFEKLNQTQISRLSNWSK